MLARRFASFVAVALAGTAFVGAASAQPGGPPGAQSVLRLVTNNAQQQIEVEIGPIAGEVRVYGIPGIPSGTLYTGVTSFELVTGNSQDYVEFRVFSDIVPSILLNTRAGNSDVKFLYFSPSTLATVESTVTVLGFAGNDKVDFQVESLAAGFAGNWTVNSGSGENDVNVNLFSPEVSDLANIALNVASGNLNDKIAVNMLTDSASTSLALSGSTAGGSDNATVAIEQLGAGTISSAFNLNLGDAADAADIKVLARGGATSHSGSILGGAGIDSLVFSAEADGIFNLTLNGGSDSDNLDFFAKGVVGGSPTLRAGNGDDFLKLVIDGPLGATSLADGGAGFDYFTGFANTVINCESVN